MRKTLPDGRAAPAHRPGGACCPTERGPGGLDGCPFSEAFPACSCSGDGDCSRGVNGRCLNPDDSPVPGCYPFCSYDECFTDSDCSGNVPCQCRSPGLASGAPANQCLVDSNCRVDSDCGPGGLCSPTYAELTSAAQICASFDGPEAFFCHTPQDGCAVDSDCSAPLVCGFDAPQRRWACISVCDAPP